MNWSCERQVGLAETKDSISCKRKAVFYKVENEKCNVNGLSVEPRPEN